MSIPLSPRLNLVGLILGACLSITALHADPLHDAAAKLDAPDDHTSSRAEAFHELLVLDTPESLREILRHFPTWWDEGHSEVEGALIKPKRLPQVLQEMERLLAEPTFPVNTAFLSFYMFRSFVEQNPAPVPGDPISSPEYISAQQKYNRKKQDYNWALLQKAEQYQPLKQGPAQTSLILALYNLMDNTGPDYSYMRLPYTHKEFVALRTRLQEELAQRLNQIPKKDLLKLLANHEKAFLSPSLLPMLLSLYDEPSDYLSRMHEEIVRPTLLKYIHVLAPEKAQALLLRDLRGAETGLGASVLQLLPHQLPPDMDDIILHLLDKEDSNLAGPLLNHCGSPKLVPQIRERRQECLKSIDTFVAEKRDIGSALAREATYLAYLIKFDPIGTEPEVEKSYQARDVTHRWTLLERLLEYTGYSPFLHKLLTIQLNDTDLSQAAPAAGLLSKYGDQEAKSALWQRLEHYHQQYLTDLAKLVKDTAPKDNHGGMSFDWTLADALFTSPNWILNKAEMEAIAHLCTNPETKKSVSYWTSEYVPGPVPICINPGANDHWPTLDSTGLPGMVTGNHVFRTTQDNWLVAQYIYMTQDEALRKIAQYPKHTIFSFEFGGKMAAEDVEATYEALKKDLARLGMDLQKAPKVRHVRPLLGTGEE